VLQSVPFDGTWQTERAIFRDVETGATIVRLTNDPWANQLSYFRGNWGADGRYVVFRRRPGMWERSTVTHGPMIVRSDGRQLRNAFRDYHLVRQHVCSPTDPCVCYAMNGDNRLVAFDLRSGNVRQIVRAMRACWQLKISPDGKYLMGRGPLDRAGKGLWIVSSDGREYHEIPVPEAIHDSYQFHPSQKKIMFWYEDRYRQEGFVQCDFDGKNMTKVPIQFDWNHGDMGLDRGAHTGGYITRIQDNAWLPKEPLFAKPGVEYYDNPANYNGYLTWMPKDRPWVYATRSVGLPYLSEIQAFPTEPAPDGVVNRYRICYTGLKRSVVLDNPDASPDGTKVLFNSNMFGQVDVYYVVARLPERPVGVKVDAAAEGVRLMWTAPAHHAEIAGYHVYRSAQSGVGFVPLTRTPVPAMEFTDRHSPAAGTMFYAVTAVEHSGLESGLSEEATMDRMKGAKRRLFVETEKAKCQPGMWIGFDGRASNLQYVWMRAHEREGHAALAINLPELRGPCQVWARVRGEKGAQFTLSAQGKSVSLHAHPSREWTWVKFRGALSLKPGKCEALLASSTYGSAVDCLALSDDPDFAPAASPRIEWPKLPVVSRVEAAVTSPYTVNLAWQCPESDTFHHYNLYCGHVADFAVEQSRLVASPDRNGYYDWGLTPGQTIYYRVTVVDRAGNESAPSSPVQVVLPKLHRVLIEKHPAATIDFDVPKSGTYVVWLKLKRGKGSGQYIDVKPDSARGATWTCAFDGLSDESWFTYDQWGRLPLTVGQHRLTIENKTPHTITALLLTNDFSYKPEGHANILSGW
jgi:hypothetical protein